MSTLTQLLTADQRSKTEPDFLYIGTSKSGSSWLAQILREHPDVFIPITTDLEFFDHGYHKGIEWYRSYFSGRGRARAAGELSPDYFTVAEAAQRIETHLPKAKLIACLREPVDRAISRYRYARAHEIDANVSFSDYAFRERIIAEGLYGENLARIFDRFPREQILVLFFEEIAQNPANLVRKVYRFIGVDEEFRPPSLFKKILAARQARIATLGRIAYASAKVLRRAGLAGLIGPVKESALFTSLLYRPIAPYPDVPQDVRRRLHQLFAPDLVKLQRLLGVALPPGWLGPKPPTG